jgi:glutaredoxin-dependent peroxiredoxin
MNNMKIEIGQKAPDFTLVDTEKNKVTLSQQKGKNVVLLFFPMAFTGVCTKELCSVRDNIAAYNHTNAQVYGISVDSPFTLAKFKEEQGLNFPLLSDFNKEASTSYGALYEDFIGWMKGVSKRSAFVVDADGIVRYAQVLDSAGDLPDFDAVMNSLKELA